MATQSSETAAGARDELTRAARISASTPDEDAARADYHARWMVEQEAATEAKRQRDQAAALLAALEAGKATDQQVRAALMYLLRREMGL